MRHTANCPRMKPFWDAIFKFLRTVLHIPAPTLREQATAAQYANFDSARMLKLISHIVESTEDVGRAFPEEARKIHYKEAPERQIRGTASPQEVDALRDEGIDVIPLPVPPNLGGKTH